MKKFILLFFVLYTSVNIYSQNISVANLLKVYNKENATQVGSLARTWGYRLNKNYSDVSDWLWGKVKVNKASGVYETTGNYATLAFYPDFGYKGKTVIWSFSDRQTFSTLQNQLKNNGWKVKEEKSFYYGQFIFYEKKGSSNELYLVEYAEDGGFAIAISDHP